MSEDMEEVVMVTLKVYNFFCNKILSPAYLRAKKENKAVNENYLALGEQLLL